MEVPEEDMEVQEETVCLLTKEKNIKDEKVDCTLRACGLLRKM